MSPRFPKLTVAILDAVAKGNPPFTAQGVTAKVRKTLPLASHQSVISELARLVKLGQVQELHEPHLPARYRPPVPKPAPQHHVKQLSLLP